MRYFAPGNKAKSASVVSKERSNICLQFPLSFDFQTEWQQLRTDPRMNCRRSPGWCLSTCTIRLRARFQLARNILRTQRNKYSRPQPRLIEFCMSPILCRRFFPTRIKAVFLHDCCFVKNVKRQPSSSLIINYYTSILHLFFCVTLFYNL